MPVRARVVTGGPAPLALERRFEQNLHELFGSVEQRGEIDRALGLERFAHAFIVAHAHTFELRRNRGSIREGHGDLRAEHVLLDGDVRIVDCVEFDRGLRQLDVADDLAFLVFDLAARGGERFGKQLVEAYRSAGGDPGDDALIAFYAAYRALVRSKVALMLAAQHPAGGAAHGHDSAEARELIALAERFAWRARLPLVVVVCGLPASGKSYLASALAQESGLPHLSSDVTRKRLAGIRPRQRAPTAIYNAEFNRLTYEELGRRAAREVAGDGGALVDATFRHRADRDAFADAFRGMAPLLFIECRPPARVLGERAVQRDRQPGRVSDASLAVVVRESSAWEPLDELSSEAHVTLRSDRRVEAQLADLRALLDRRIGQLPRAAE